uniref:Uncharacterized protein n=1 Tax=Anguilla anguilla TaxID=7936 RepID=A0A0E9S4M2_ANGAN
MSSVNSTLTALIQPLTGSIWSHIPEWDPNVIC